MTPRVGPFLPRGHNLSKLVRSLLADATYQNGKALGFVVSDNLIFISFHLELLFLARVTKIYNGLKAKEGHMRIIPVLGLVKIQAAF